MARFDEFADLLRTRLGAIDARLVGANEDSAAPGDGGSNRQDGGGNLQTEDTQRGPGDASLVVLESRLPNGARVVVRFDAPVEPIATLQERLDRMVILFSNTLEGIGAANEPGSEQKWHTLQQLLCVLANRAGALEIVVIDAHSPVVWGVAYGDARILEQEPAPPDNVRWLHAPHDQRGPAATARNTRAAELGVGRVDTLVQDPSVAGSIPLALSEKYRLLPLYETSAGLLVAMADPTNLDAVRQIVEVTGRPVEPVLAPEGVIQYMTAWNRQCLLGPEPVKELDAATRAQRAQIAEDTAQRLRCRFAAREAIRMVRGLAEIPTLRKGGHVNRTLTGERQSVVVRSFGGIYVLVVLLPRGFDELRAKHAISQALPAIENLVVSLPPRTPLGPQGAANALRRR